MPTYDHVCKDCHVHIELNLSVSEYEEIEEKYGRDEKENVRVPCPECDGWASRDYSFGCAAAIVKGGYKYEYDMKYRAGAEEEFVRNEIHSGKERLKKGGSSQHRPYSNYYIADPEAAGFKKVDSQTAAAKADVAKKSVGAHHAKVEQARKR